MNIYYEDEDPKKEDNADAKPVETPSEQPKQEFQPELSPNNKKRNIIIASISLILIGLIGYFSYSHFNKPIEAEVPITDSCIAKTNSDIYDYYKNSVVMIKHRFGLQIRINGSDPIVLEDYYVQNFEYYATGFFVDDNGTIITNRHVVQPAYPYPEDMQTEFKNIKIKIVANLPKDTDPSLYKEKIYQILHEGSLLNEEAASTEEIDSLDIDNIEPTLIEYFSNGEIEIEPVSLELQVMPHDASEWLACNFLKSTEDYNIDIAAIQLQSKSTPSTISNYPNIYNAMLDDATIKPGTKAIMIGFPMGMNLANTNNGIIKAQMYEGDINKESDGIKFQYSIPSTQGASGAPVFNSCGQLIAVNYSGYDQQGFNFGIVAKHVFALFKTQ